jgi:hypothetical protein
MDLLPGLVFTAYYAGKTLVTLLLTRAGTAFSPWANVLCIPALVMQPDSASASPSSPPPHRPEGCCTHDAVTVDRLRLVSTCGRR